MRNSRYLWTGGPGSERAKASAVKKARSTQLFSYLCISLTVVYMFFLVRNTIQWHENQPSGVDLGTRVSGQGQEGAGPAAGSVKGPRDMTVAVNTDINAHASAEAPAETETSSSIDFIWVDWTLPSTRLTALNYEQLETLLSLYADATVRIALIGPESANYYKTGVRISKHQFQRYRKGERETGHATDVKVVVLSKPPGFTTPDATVMVPPPSAPEAALGELYWTHAHDACCGPTTANSIRSGEVAPWHLSMFANLHRLYQYGGLAIDLSTRLRDRIPRQVQAGAAVHVDCWTSEKNDKETREECYASSVLVFRRPRHAVPLCMLHKYDEAVDGNTFLACISGNDMHQAVRCMQTELQHCFREARERNALGTTSSVGAVVDWLGREGASGNWTAAVRHGSRANMNVDATHSSARCVNTMPAPTCSHYALDGSVSDAAVTASNRAQASLSCAPAFVMPGFMKAGTTFAFSTITRHPHILNPLVGVSFKETGCYLPSEMSARRAANRMNCFPFVRSGEKFIFGDGTTYYAGSESVPRLMHKDNPQLRALFVLRDPIQRMLSHHRYAYKGLLKRGLGNVNDLVYFALAGTHLQALRDAAEALVACINSDSGSDLSTTLSPFSGGCAHQRQALLFEYHTGNSRATITYKYAASVLKNSLYAPALLHWAAVLGGKQVMAVDLERLQTTVAMAKEAEKERQAVRRELWGVYDFLGVCRTNFVPSERIHSTDKKRLSADHVLNATVVGQLQAFLIPFEGLLAGVREELYASDDVNVTL